MKGNNKSPNTHFLRRRVLLLALPLILLSVLLTDCEYQPYSQGENLYKFYCANCHMETGLGLKGLIPPLAKADYLRDHQTDIPCLIKNGIKGNITVNGREYNTEMAGIPNLTDVQINNIINYINNAWGNKYGDSNVKKVKKALKQCD